MIKNAKTQNHIKIQKKTISISALETFKMIVIEYIGELKINTLLSKNYKFIRSNQKLWIHNTYKNKNIVQDLFDYRGTALITRCTMYDFENNKINLNVDKTAVQIWNNLHGINQLEGFKTYDWDTLTTNWDDMDFDGKNNKIKYIHRSAEKASDGVITKTREIRKK